MSFPEFIPNVQLSEFALKLRRYRRDNGLTPGEVCRQLGVSLERLGMLELDRAKPTALEKFRLNRLLAKQKTASTK